MATKGPRATGGRNGILHRPPPAAARFTWSALAIAVGVSFHGPAAWASAAPGAQLHGNLLLDFTSSQQINPAVASDATYYGWVVWQSDGMGGEEPGIHRSALAFFGANDASRVNTSTAGTDTVPDIAASDDSRTVIAWHRTTATAQGTQTSIVLRCHREFQATSGEVTAATFTESSNGPRVAMDADGDIVVAWDRGTGVYARRYTRGCLAKSAAVRVDQPGAEGGNPDVAADGVGNFIVTWASPSTNTIFARRFDARGRALGEPFAVTTAVPADRRDPSIAAAADGQFVIAWHDHTTIFAKTFGSTGVPDGNAFVVNTSTGGFRLRPDAAMDDDGDFIIVWDGNGAQGLGVYGRRFWSIETPAPAEFLVGPPATQLVTSNPAVSMDADGDFTAVWDRHGDVRASRYAGPENVDLNVSVTGDTQGVPYAPMSFRVFVTNEHAPSATPGVGAAVPATVRLKFGSEVTEFTPIGSDWSCTRSAVLGEASCFLNESMLPAGAETFIDVTAVTAVPGTTSLEARVEALDQYDADPADDMDTLTVVVLQGDPQPSPFAFTDKQVLFGGFKTTSNRITITGFGTPAPISIAGEGTTAEYQINSGPWTSAPGVLYPGQSVRLRATPSSQPGGVVSATLTVGGVSDTWTVTRAP